MSRNPNLSSSQFFADADKKRSQATLQETGDPYSASREFFDEADSARSIEQNTQAQNQATEAARAGVPLPPPSFDVSGVQPDTVEFKVKEPSPLVPGVLAKASQPFEDERARAHQRALEDRDAFGLGVDALVNFTQMAIQSTGSVVRGVAEAIPSDPAMSGIGTGRRSFVRPHHRVQTHELLTKLAATLPETQQSALNTIAAATGSTVPFLLSGPYAWLVGGLSGLGRAQEAIDRAFAEASSKGLPPPTNLEEIARAAIGTAVGTTEAVPVSKFLAPLAKRFPSLASRFTFKLSEHIKVPAVASGKIQDLIAKVPGGAFTKTAIEAAAAETIQELLAELTEQEANALLLDLERDADFREVITGAAGAGATLSIFTQLLAKALGGRRVDLSQPPAISSRTEAPAEQQPSVQEPTAEPTAIPQAEEAPDQPTRQEPREATGRAIGERGISKGGKQALITFNDRADAEEFASRPDRWPDLMRQAWEKGKREPVVEPLLGTTDTFAVTWQDVAEGGTAQEIRGPAADVAPITAEQQPQPAVREPKPEAKGRRPRGGVKPAEQQAVSAPDDQPKPVAGDRTTAGIPIVRVGGVNPFWVFPDEQSAQNWANTPEAWSDLMQQAVSQGKRRPTVDLIGTEGQATVRFEDVPPDERRRQPIKGPEQPPQPAIPGGPPEGPDQTPVESRPSEGPPQQPVKGSAEGEIEPKAPLPQEGPDIKPIRGFHTVPAKAAPETKFSFRQRGSGVYIALDKPFQPDRGTVKQVEVRIPASQILDPNGLMPGTNVEQSRKDFNEVIDEANELHAQGKEPKDLPHTQDILHQLWQQRGYRAEAGWIDGPERGERELVVWDKADVKFLEEETPHAGETGQVRGKGAKGRKGAGQKDRGRKGEKGGSQSVRSVPESTKGAAEEERLTQEESERLRGLTRMGVKRRTSQRAEEEFQRLKAKKPFRRVTLPRQFNRKRVESEIIRLGRDIEEATQGPRTRLAAANDSLAEVSPFTFDGPLPTEVKEHFEGRTEVLTKLKGNVRGAHGEEIIETIGAEQYYQLVEQEFRGGDTIKIENIRAATQGQESGDFDPELSFLLHIHEKLADPNAKLSAQQVVKTEDLKIGDKFTIHGEEFEVIQDEFGQKVLQDDKPFIADALKQIPVDKGSLEQAKATQPQSEREKPKVSPSERFRQITKVAADSPEQLRPVDVGRALDEADEQGVLPEYTRWLLEEAAITDRAKSRVQQEAKERNISAAPDEAGLAGGFKRGDRVKLKGLGAVGKVAGPGPDNQVLVEYDNGVSGLVQVRNLESVSEPAPRPSRKKSSELFPPSAESTLVRTRQGAIDAGGSKSLLDRLKITDADFRAASALISDDIPVGSGMEAAFVSGVKQAKAEQKTPEFMASLNKRARSMVRHGFTLYRDSNPLERSGESAQDKKIREQFGEGEGTGALFEGSEPSPKAAMVEPGPELSDDPDERRELARRSDIVKILDNVMGPIRIGRARGLGTKFLGLAFIKKRETRLAAANDVETAAHEVGHHLHKIMWGLTQSGRTLNQKALAAWTSELHPLGEQTALSKDKRTIEGVAEFTRLYVTDPNQALERAPTFFKAFEAKLAEMPEVQNGLLAARNLWKDYQAMPMAQKVAAVIRRGAETRRRMNFKQVIRGLYPNFLDDQVQIKRVMRTVVKAHESFAGQAKAIIDAAWVMRGEIGRIDAMLRHEVFDFNMQKVEGVKPLVRILEPMFEGGETDQFDIYLTARREKELRSVERLRKKLGREPTGAEKAGLKDAGGMHPDVDPQKAMDEVLAKYPHFEEAAVEVTKFARAVRNYFAASGFLSGDSVAAMDAMNKMYVPFFRWFDPDALLPSKLKARGLGSQSFVDQPKGVHHFRSSKRDIISPLESLFKNTEVLMTLADRNRVGSMLTLLTKVQDTARWVSKLEKQKDVKPTKIEIQEIKKQLEELGVEVDPDIAEEIVTIFRPTALYPGKPDEHFFTVWQDGKRITYEAHPDLYESIKALDVHTAKFFVKLLSVPAKSLRVGATSVPEFWVKNIARDQVFASIVSNFGYNPFADLPRGVYSLVRRDQDYVGWLKGGGAQSMFLSQDLEELRLELKQMLELRQKGVKKIKPAGKFVMRHPIQSLRLFGAASELATRLGGFKKSLSDKPRTRSELERAARDSRDMTIDFSRMGRYGRWMNTVTAFWNPAIQDPDRIIRAARENPKGFFLKATLLVTVPTIIETLYLYDDEEYRDMAQWRKDLFWHAKIGGKLYSVFPKPFLLGTIFSNMPRNVLTAALDSYAGNRTTLLDDMKKTFLHAGIPGIAPTFALPLLEMGMNWSTFFNRPIEPESLRRLEAQDRFVPHTSDIARHLARMSAKIPVFKDAPVIDAISPIKIEHLVYSWTGGLGRYTLQAGDAILNQFIERPEGAKPEPTASDLPLLRMVVPREYTTATKSMDQFYTRYVKVQAMVASYKKTPSKARRDELRREPLWRKHVSLTAEGPRNKLAPTAVKLTKLRRSMRAVSGNPNLDAKEKRERLNGLLRRVMLTARRRVGTFD